MTTRRSSRTDLVLPAILLALGCYVFLYELGSIPLRSWDESRPANNALEMVHNGNLIATYFDGKPDL